MLIVTIVLYILGGIEEAKTLFYVVQIITNIKLRDGILVKNENIFDKVGLEVDFEG